MSPIYNGARTANANSAQKPIAQSTNSSMIKRVTLLLMLAAFVGLPAEAQTNKPKNVILMISDGCGPATFTLARDYQRFSGGGDALHLDAYLVGNARTWASDARVTDSAAGATAFSAGVKTYNGAIAVDTLRRPVATLLEAAEAEGKVTGLVATSRITHATPASFAAHVPNRAMEDVIALQMIRSGVDVVIGGGAQHFLPRSEGGRRTDNQNLFERLSTSGAQVTRSRAGFDAAEGMPFWSLFTASHMAYEVDRSNTEEPSLAEMTEKAIALLSQEEAGFFLMVEGSRIDHAGHGNDLAGHIHDALAYDAAWNVAQTFAEQNGETLVISVSDHETGGLSLGRDGVYNWYPEHVDAVTATIEAFRNQLGDTVPSMSLLDETFSLDGMGAEEQEILTGYLEEGDTDSALSLVNKFTSKRAGIAWTTSGHTAVDVNLYAFGPTSDQFAGSHDNAAVGRMLAHVMGYDLEALTTTLRGN